MKSIVLALSALLLASVAVIAVSGENGDYRAFLATEAGEYVYVNTKEYSATVDEVAFAFEKAGYTRLKSVLDAPENVKPDTWCGVEVYKGEVVAYTCFSPGRNFNISLWYYTLGRPVRDYSEVPDMIAQLRDKHRRASALLGTKFGIK